MTNYEAWELNKNGNFEKDFCTIVEHYNYKYLKKIDTREYAYYFEGTVLEDGMSFLQGIELILLRLNILLSIKEEIDQEVMALSKSQKTGKAKTDIGIFKNAIGLIEKYAYKDSNEAKALIDGLQNCIKDINLIDSNKEFQDKGGGITANIHYGYNQVNSDIKILKKYVNNFKPHKGNVLSKAISQETNLLFRELESGNYTYDKKKLKEALELFKNAYLS